MKHTDEVIQKRREANLGEKNYWCNIGPMLGKQFSDEHKQKISKLQSGEKSCLWKARYVPWNKGLKGKPYLEHYPNGIGVPKGSIPWNKGLNKKEMEKHYPNGMKGTIKGGTPWNKGKPMDDATKRKLSMKNAEFLRSLSRDKDIVERRRKFFLENNPMNNPTLRKKVSESKKGPKNHFWKGGKSFEEYGIEFNSDLRKLIRHRDNYTCQECGYTEKELGYTLSVHHMDYNKKSNDTHNLILLCRSCHSKTGSQRDYWKARFEAIILGVVP